MNPQFPALLEARLAQPLAGPAIDTRFEPLPRLGRHYHEVPPEARQAAVLLLFYPHAGQWHLPLTLRPTHLPDHAGQISLPGGAIEPGETGCHAAVREFHEELGALGHPLRLLGRLSTIYVRASNFAIEALGGLLHRAAIAGTQSPGGRSPPGGPLAASPGSRHARQSPTPIPGPDLFRPHFLWQSHEIWGATCMILGELVLLLEEMGGAGVVSH